LIYVDFALIYDYLCCSLIYDYSVLIDVDLCWLCCDLWRFF